MKIDVLTLPQFTNLNIQAPRGHNNSGGGMACLINATKAALMERYSVNICTDLSEVQSDFILMDALFIGNASVYQQRDMLPVLEEFRSKNPDTTIILWCAEKTIFRLKPKQLYDLKEFVNGIVVTDPYLWNLCKAINVTPIGYLCDAIDPNLFRPSPKQMVVSAVGALKHIKNVDWVIEVYRLLEGKISRIYVGGDTLWSLEKRSEDIDLIAKIKSVTEFHYSDVSYVEVAYRNSYTAFSLNDTWHDCSSRSNEELLMSGVISIYGQHPLFYKRPGFKVKTAEEAVDKMAELTDNFTKLPDTRLQKESRDWALKNVSSSVFMNQFEALVKCFI